jgi:TolB protein
MRPDGSDPHALATGSGYSDNFPAWSPDGTHIVFQSDRGLPDGRRGIFIMEADGANLRTIGPTAMGYVGFPAWSPDGRKILFSAGASFGEADLYVMNVDGSALRQVTSSPGSERCGEWKPDGSRIVYAWTFEGVFGVMTVDQSGGEPERVPPAGFQADCADWSPDGRFIAFASPTDHEYPPAAEMADWRPVIAIYVIELATGDIVQLTSNDGRASYPSWSGDGAYIAFHSTLGGTLASNQELTASREIYTVRADGTDLRRLTRNQWFDGHPSW